MKRQAHSTLRQKSKFSMHSMNFQKEERRLSLHIDFPRLKMRTALQLWMIKVSLSMENTISCLKKKACIQNCIVHNLVYVKKKASVFQCTGASGIVLINNTI